MSDIDIEIDGKLLKAKPNSMVIQVADEAGMYIPRFCYHKHLSIAANCRMCLVEVEKAPKPLPACATPVAPGMKVWTRSPKALAAQKAVMEFLLINHPLDCPICDQGGECELQDLSMGYGSAESFFKEGKRAVKDQDIGPLIETEMTRCIQCTRCVRFGTEVAGLRELGATGRGEHMEIGTYIEQALQSEVSGNIIDLCPVGALTSKPFRFTARAWELQQYSSIASHDGVGANIYVHTRRGQVMRVVARENKSINETWISDRDRFSYEGLYVDREVRPRIRIKGVWQETDWQTALEHTVQRLKESIQKSGADQLGGLISPNATIEEHYLFQKCIRQLGSHHIDHRLRQVDFSTQDSETIFPGLSIASLADLESFDTILLIGSNIQKEQPSAGLRVRKATLKGANVLALNMMDYTFHFKVAAKHIVAPHEFVEAVMTAEQTFKPYFTEGKKVIILLGPSALHHPQASVIYYHAQKIAKAYHAEIGVLTEGANAAGAWVAGTLPRGSGLHAQAMLHDPRRAYILFNVEPNLDCAHPVLAQRALKQADFVLSLSIFKNPVLEEFADVILPIVPFTETGGTFVNMTGVWQSFQGVAQPHGEARPAWKVLRVLGNLLDLSGFEYESVEAVLAEIKALTPPNIKSSFLDAEIKNNIKTIESESVRFSRVGDVPLYSTDSLVRRASALQSAQEKIEGKIAIHLHPETAAMNNFQEHERVRVRQQDHYVELPVIFDDRLPRQAVWVPGGVVETQGLSELYGSIDIEKIK